jgi:hypothetical protein
MDYYIIWRHGGIGAAIQARSYRARTTAREPSFFVTRAAQAAGVLIDPRFFVRFRVFFVGVCQHVQLPPM